MVGATAALSTAVDRWNAVDLDGYLHLYDDAIRLHGYSPEPMDKTQVRDLYAGIFTSFDSPKLDIHEAIADGELVACRFTMTGAHVGSQVGALPAPA